jgi:hypothetical protein
MKAIMGKETLVKFPSFTKEFEIHTDARKLQLGACISQGGKPVAFYSRKLQPAQTHYRTQVTLDGGNTQRISKYIAGPKD